MNKLSTLVAALTLVAAGASAAQDAAPLSREAVIAELAAARNNGELAALQAEKGVHAAMPSTAAASAARLPRQAVLTLKTPDARQPLAQSAAADHGENAARELGDFPAPIVRRSPALASR